MKIALVNPPWSFEGSIYFGCREPHLPVEFGYSKALLERAGHDAILIDAQMDGLTFDEVRRLTAAFGPDMTVTTSAPSYLFWRCAPPELRVPMQMVRALREVGGTLIAVGPHASTTPIATLRKLVVDAVVLGECEEVLVELADSDRDGWREIESIAYAKDRVARVQGGTRAADMAALPALHWPAAAIARHHHHHHRFDAAPSRPGAEMETSRGCPYHCTFCAKDNFRNRFRRRPLEVILRELDALIAQRVEYVYFIDEIFLPNAPLLEALSQREIKFGIQTRVDLWSPQQLELLGKAG